MILFGLRAVSIAILLVLTIYLLRHLLFAMNRLFSPQRMDYSDIAGFHLPSISVLIPMHNEEAVAPDVLEALLESDYPRESDRFEIIPINDHSIDRTGEILNAYGRRYPCVKPLHRHEGARGKAAALKSATHFATGEILILFDADYVPGKSLLKFLAAPFADPEVGAVMGRVVPQNVGSSLLTRLLDLERAGGYQVNQQARYNLGLIPQYGGTAGGVRRKALEAVGGWHAPCLTEDTDLTFRLAIQGWKIAYVNRAECYEEAPATWEVRRRQIERWAIGHTECLHRYLGPLLRSPCLSAWAKFDGMLLLCVYLMAPLIVIGWLASVALFFASRTFLPAIAAFFLAAACFNSVGNFASFFELGSSVILDGTRRRVRLLPLNIVNFVFSTVAVCRALLRYYFERLRHRHIPWNKTIRYRKRNGSSRGDGKTAGPAQTSGDGRGLDFIRARSAMPETTRS